MIKHFVFLFVLCLSCARDKNYNLPDIEDKNRIPAHLENREDEFMNSPDETDPNQTPAGLEERAEEEERIRVYEEPVF